MVWRLPKLASLRGPRGPRFLLGVLCAGVFLTGLDQTVVVTALPSMMQDLRIPVARLDQAFWIVSGYLLGYTVALPLLGRVADAHGYLRVYLSCLAVFTLASVAIPLAPNLTWLVVFRVVQALGGGALVPATLSMATLLFSWRRWAVVLGVVAAVAEAGSVLGPLYGGLIVEGWEWQGVFWVNVPLGVTIALPLLLLAPAFARRGVKVDYAGGLLLGASLAALLMALRIEEGTLGATPWSVGWGLASFVAFLLFVAREARCPHPLVPMDLFRRRTFLTAGLTHLLVGAALIIALVNVPLITDTLMGQSSLEGGLRLMRLTAMIPVGALAGGVLTRRLGYRPPTVLGLLVSALGFYLMRQWTLDTVTSVLTLHLLLAGLGFGLVIAPLVTAMTDSAAEEERGIATSLFVLTRMLGMVVGLAAMTAWGMSGFRIMVGGIPMPVAGPGETAQELQQRLLEYQGQVTQVTLQLFHNLFLAGAAVCVAALVPALGMRGGQRRHRA